MLVGVISGNQTVGGPPPPPPPPDTFYSPYVEGIAYDNGLYNAFSLVEQYTDGSLINGFGSKASHAAGGAFVFGRSTDGGATWTHTNISVTGYGTLTNVAAFAFGLIKEGANAGRILIAWQDDTYSWIKFGYRDDIAGAFTYAGQVNAPSGFQFSTNGAKIKLTTDGTFGCGYYTFSGPSTESIGFITTTDDGETWTYQPPVYTLANISEFDWCITHDTGSPSTWKVIIIARIWLPFDGATYYYFLKSTDGGTTFTYDSTSDAGSFVNDHGETVNGPFERGRQYSFLTSNGPACVIKHNGEIIVACSERASGSGWTDYNLKFIKASPDDAFENNFFNWTRPMKIRGYNSEELGSSIDCGYVNLFQYQEEEGGDLKLGFQDYDVSAETMDGGITTRRCHIYQGSLEDWLAMPSGVYRTDIIALGGGLWSGYTNNFNTDWSFAPGDAIRLAAGTYGAIEIMGDSDEVWIVGPISGVATVQRISFGDWGRSPKIISHPANPLREASLVINDGAQIYFAPYIRSTGDVLVRGITVENCRMGPQVETRISVYANLAAFPVIGAFDHNYKATDSGLWYSWNGTTYTTTLGVKEDYQTAKILNCVVNNVYFEGTYNGADAASPVPTNSIIRNCTYTNTGRDGCQVRNGSLLVEDVYIEDAGLNNEGPHGHGFTAGANSSGLIARRVKVINASANSCFCNTMGDSVFEVCSFKGGGEYGFYMNNYAADTDDVFGEGQQTATFKNCEFQGTLGAIWIQRDPANCPMTVNRYSTNTYTGSVNIETSNGIDDNVLT